MGQSVFTWIIIYETFKSEKRIEQFIGTWDLLIESLRDDPISIIRTDSWK